MGGVGISRYGIGTPYRRQHYEVSLRSQRASVLREATLVIWEEITMINKRNLEAVDVMLRRVRDKSHSPFGGLLFIGAGGFYQIPPILEHAYREATVQTSIKFSKLWEIFQVFALTVPLRQEADPQFSQFVDEIANGAFPSDKDGKVILSLITATTDVEYWKQFVCPKLPSTEPFEFR
ncbi:hypothetical protein RvY_13125 [Ramazzottius varieornatus]|uniref:ATP-dependent DNA helicase n=1 Tax=Ramazzottius varieornatus TaxID=947166 RepID=A0A1D1VNQ4_RAMVA|nr:hypothetical protein RvY_13125 [Ramazzottius varieornatus]